MSLEKTARTSQMKKKKKKKKEEEEFIFRTKTKHKDE